jgi:hypothetical protein
MKPTHSGDVNPIPRRDTDAPTRRQQVLAYAASRPPIEERAIRARLSIRQTHLTEVDHDTRYTSR